MYSCFFVRVCEFLVVIWRGGGGGGLGAVIGSPALSLSSLDKGFLTVFKFAFIINRLGEAN